MAEGDAGFYSSIHYLFDKLWADQIEVEQIAGVPAFIAAGAAAGLHIVKQTERLLVIPATDTAYELIREVTEDDLLRLLDIKIARILKINKAKADELIARMKEEVARIDNDLENLTDVGANWFRPINEK